MDKPNKGDGCQQVLERDALHFDSNVSSGSHLGLHFDPGHLSHQTEIKVRSGNKVMKYQSRHHSKGFPYGRRRRRRKKAQLCILVPDGNSETTSEPTPKQLIKPRRQSWRLALGNDQDLEVTQLELEEASTSKDLCGPTSNIISMGIDEAKTVGCNHKMNCELRAYPGSKHIEEAEELGKRRKAQGKRKNVETCEKNCLDTAAIAEKQKEAAALEETRRQTLCKQRAECLKRLAKVKGHPLKRTYGETKLNQLGGAMYQNNRVRKGHRSEGLPSIQRVQSPTSQLEQRQKSNSLHYQIWDKEAQQGPDPRGIACPNGQFGIMVRRSGCCYGVRLSDAQTQTESFITSQGCQCHFSQPSTSNGCSTSQTSTSQTSTQRSDKECVSHDASQTSVGESSSQGSSRTSVSKSSDQSSETCTASSDAQRAVGSQPSGADLGFPGPSLDRTRRAAPGGRRRISSTMTTRALSCAENPHRKRRVTARIMTSRAQQSQDNWGCLIF